MAPFWCFVVLPSYPRQARHKCPCSSLGTKTPGRVGCVLTTIGSWAATRNKVLQLLGQALFCQQCPSQLSQLKKRCCTHCADAHSTNEEHGSAGQVTGSCWQGRSAFESGTEARLVQDTHNSSVVDMHQQTRATRAVRGGENRHPANTAPTCVAADITTPCICMLFMTIWHTT